MAIDRRQITNIELRESVSNDLRIMKQALIEIAIDVENICAHNGCSKRKGSKCECKGALIIKKTAEEALQKVAGDYNDKS